MNTKETRDYDFSKRASSYDEGWEGKMAGKFYNLLLREIKVTPGMTILDVGCGTGALLNKIVNTCDITGCGIDIEEKMLAEARKKRPEMDFQIARCDNMPFKDNNFNIIISCLSYHHFDNRTGFITEAARIIKPEGVLYLADVRFPFPVRKAMNAAFRILGRVPRFFTCEEIESHFSQYGFTAEGYARDGYAQLIKLKKK